MKLSWNLLNEFVDINISPEELADKLTMTGLEVTGITRLGGELDNIVVGEVLSVDSHPNANKLTLCKVSDGKSGLEIVCGAKNVKAGDKVPLALSGASLPGGVQIETSSIRGIESHGMICSEKELGLGDDAGGILILDNEAIPGEDIKKTLGQDDIILDIDLTPNRGDCLSILGIAREVSAVLNLPLKLESVKFPESSKRTDELAKIEIQEPVLCLRYTGRVITDVKIGSSPLSLQYRLRSMGIRPINNVVDITNLMLIELGHPLHAFDYDLLEGRQIIVRLAEKGEKIVTLDEVERELDNEVLVIADSKKPVALAGIMGGLDTSVTDSTKNILLESAYFSPTSIRKSARKLDLATEASYRFERGVDVDNLVVALQRTAALIKQYCGGEVAGGIVDIYPTKISQKEIIFRPGRANKVLGIDIPPKNIEDILKRLGFNIRYQVSESAACNETKPSDSLIVAIPPYRNDVTEEIDLIEEIARIYGYDKIETSKPYWQPQEPVPNKTPVIEKLVKDILLKSGFFEVINFSFMNEEALDRLGFSSSDVRRKYLVIENPLSAEMGLLRSTLIPGILENVSRNLRRNIEDIKIFEIGSIYIPTEDELLPKEKKMLTGVVYGKESEPYWGEHGKPADFYYLSGVVETLLNSLGISKDERVGKNNTYTLRRSKDKLYHPGRAADIVLGDKILGNLGELSPAVCAGFGFSEPVYLFEIDFEALLDYVNLEKYYRPLSRYPAVTRDIALIIPAEVNSCEVVCLVRKTGKTFLKDIRLFDVYTGEQIKQGYKSLACSVMYQSDEATLTDDEVNKLHGKITDALHKKLKAEIRDK